jgi:hypothetical protein
MKDAETNVNSFASNFKPTDNFMLDPTIFREAITEVNSNAAWLTNFIKPQNEDEQLLPQLHTIDRLYLDSVDVTAPDMTSLFADYFQTLSVSEGEAKDIEVKTRGQGKNKLWMESRFGRITASNFGVVVRRRPATDPQNLLSSILQYQSFDNAAMEWGRRSEKTAVSCYRSFMQQTHPNMTVSEVGLQVNPLYPHLGASADGLIYCPHCPKYHGVLEIKCPYKHRKSTPAVAAATDKSFCCNLNDRGNVELKRSCVSDSGVTLWSGQRPACP